MNRTQAKRVKPKILERDGHRCLRCGATKNLTVDHIVPLGRGGTNRQTNLQTLCLECNAAKGDRISQRYYEPELGP